QLIAQGLRHPQVDVDEATEVALAARLDFLNEADRLEDAGRRTRLAVNALRPDLGLFAGASLASQGQNNFDELDFRRTAVEAGLDVDLPFDRKSERNSYRAA